MLYRVFIYSGGGFKVYDPGHLGLDCSLFPPRRLKEAGKEISTNHVWRVDRCPERHPAVRWKVDEAASRFYGDMSSMLYQQALRLVYRHWSSILTDHRLSSLESRGRSRVRIRRAWSCGHGNICQEIHGSCVGGGELIECLRFKMGSP